MNIPAGNTDGFEILYFGVNLLLMFDYRLSFRIEARGPDNSHQIELLIISRKDVSAWKKIAETDHNSSGAHKFTIYYRNKGRKINGIFKPTISDAYAFILSNRSYASTSQELRAQAVMVTLTHSWKQEIKESQLQNRP